MSFKSNTKIPVMTVGKYAGKFVDTLPNSYLRWICGQQFSVDILECARKKLESSDYNDIDLHISRHAIDMFSKRFIALWVSAEGNKGEDAVGLATFIATLAQQAWEHGNDVSKHRHQDDGTVKEYDGVKWVFNVNPNYPDYKDVITVMPGIEQSVVL